MVITSLLAISGDVYSRLLMFQCHWYTYWLTLFILSVLLSIVFVLLTKGNENQVRSRKLLESFPGPNTIPLLGNVLLLNKENHQLFDFAEEMVKVYGKLSRLWLFHKPYVLIADADVVEKILTSKVNLDKGDDMKVFHPWWGSGLLTASATKWRSQRKLLNHTFCHSILMEFMDIFNKESLLLTNRLEKLALLEKPLNFIPHVTACTLNIICETAMGRKLLTDGNVNQEYIDAVTGMYHILLARMTRPWLRPNIIWRLSSYSRREQKYLKILHGFTEKVIAEKKKIRRERASLPKKDEEYKIQTEVIEGKKVRMAFMDYLLDLADKGHELSDTDIRNEVDTFMAAGHDTTAYTVSWTLFLLATYPEHQVKVQQELNEIFENDKTRAVTATDLSKMTYLGLCIKEALRIYPIVPFNFRKISEDVYCDNEKIIPAGVNVVIMPYLIHRDPVYFPDPDTFQPDRFLAENCKKRHHFSYLPFSLGIRNCIGQKFGIYEAKVILSYLLRNFDWVALEKRENIQLDLDLVIRPMHGLHFKLIRKY